MDDDGYTQSFLSLPTHLGRNKRLRPQQLARGVPQGQRSEESNLSVDEMKSRRGHVSTTPPAKRGTILQPSPESPSSQGCTCTPSPAAESAHAKSLLLSIHPSVGPVSVEDASTPRGSLVCGVTDRVWTLAPSSIPGARQTLDFDDQNEPPADSSHVEVARGTPTQSNTGVVAIPATAAILIHGSH